MKHRFQGNNLIAGEWVESETTFRSDPVVGAPISFHDGTVDMVDAACVAAEDASWTYGNSTVENRAAFLNVIADEIEKRAESITKIGSAETGLPEARLIGERGRTTGQLRYFADYILRDDYPEVRHDPALPDRTPLPRPDLKLVHRPIGPVAIFGASNFPLAFSVAGGDTAGALAAGCPVVFKAHPAHPGTCEIIADAIHEAVVTTQQPAGTFSMIHGAAPEIGGALVQHQFIQAVGFTGSLRVGRILFDLCAARSTPIPFFGELGAINPVFVLPSALDSRGSEIANGWTESLTMGVGQFCTNPGVIIVPEGDAGDAFVNQAASALQKINAQAMLTSGIAQAYRSGINAFEKIKGVDQVVKNNSTDRNSGPSLFQTTTRIWNNNKELREEVFGPFGLIVRTENENEMLTIAQELQGQLTATLQMSDGDVDIAKKLLRILERKAGRILANGFPTGVEVADAMVHGGPYPASTNFGASSVGSLALQRFVRPVCFQNLEELLGSH